MERSHTNFRFFFCAFVFELRSRKGQTDWRTDGHDQQCGLLGRSQNNCEDIRAIANREIFDNYGSNLDIVDCICRALDSVDSTRKELFTPIRCHLIRKHSIGLPVRRSLSTRGRYQCVLASRLSWLSGKAAACVAIPRNKLISSWAVRSTPRSNQVASYRWSVRSFNQRLVVCVTVRHSQSQFQLHLSAYICSASAAVRSHCNTKQRYFASGQTTTSRA